MSFNNNSQSVDFQEEEKMLYRPQLLRYKYNTCLEKSRLNDSYDPDTMKSLQSLIKSTSFDLSKKNFVNRKESQRYQKSDYLRHNFGN